MSSNNVPSKVEVMGWSPQSLADYMKKLRLSGCDKIVMKSRISGAQFMQMTDSDLQEFPSLFFPIITKIQYDINNKGEQRMHFGHKPKAQKSPRQDFAQEEEVWESDEFDNQSDNDHEDPDEEEESYICSLVEPQTAEKQDSNEFDKGNSRQPGSVNIMKPSRHAKPQGVRSRDPVPAARYLKPPISSPPGMNPAPQRPLKPPAGQPKLHVDRGTKPGQPEPSPRDFPKSQGRPVKPSASFTKKFLQPKTCRQQDVTTRPDKVSPLPPVPAPRAPVTNSLPGSKQCIQGLDPSWYAGMVTRNQVEDILRENNKDGAFMVRDSSKGSVEQPYTLMLLKKGKIYNIRICKHGDSYSLGNGLKKSKSFPGVKEMIAHHTHTPLLLIDATDQSSEAQSECCLLHPAVL